MNFVQLMPKRSVLLRLLSMLLFLGQSYVSAASDRQCKAIIIDMEGDVCKKSLTDCRPLGVGDYVHEFDSILVKGEFLKLFSLTDKKLVNFGGGRASFRCQVNKSGGMSKVNVSSLLNVQERVTASLMLRSDSPSECGLAPRFSKTPEWLLECIEQAPVSSLEESQAVHLPQFSLYEELPKVVGKQLVDKWVATPLVCAKSSDIEERELLESWLGQAPLYFFSKTDSSYLIYGMTRILDSCKTDLEQQLNVVNILPQLSSSEKLEVRFQLYLEYGLVYEAYLLRLVQISSPG